MEDDRKTYLQMIQSTIERMSTTSAIFKGFCALDTYYFILEKKYRIIYELIRTGQKEADFDMRIKLKRSECIDGGATLSACLKSPSIYLFYFPLFVICIVIVIVKFCGLI